jgi:DNA-binding transcriptional ArsR family regulator
MIPTISVVTSCGRDRAREMAVDSGHLVSIDKQVLNQAAKLDGLFHALSDPSRRVMVEKLSHGPASVSELAKPLAMSMPGVIQHIQVLERSGLVTSAKVGRSRICSIDTATLRAAERWFASRRADWERRLDRLGDYLADTSPQKKGKDHGRKISPTRHRRRRTDL